MPDFDRDVNREIAGVGINEVYPILRALGRQIQDLKGPDPATGQWNWFGRQRGITDPFGNIGIPEYTTSFAIESEQVFVVGSSSSDVSAHFSGSGGLQSCLNHIATIADGVHADDTYPGRFKIVLKTGNNQAGTYFTCPDPVSFDSAEIEICVAGAGGLDSGLNGVLYNQVPVQFSHPAGTPFFTFDGGSLKMTGIRCVGEMNEFFQGNLTQLEINNCGMTFANVQSFFCDWRSRFIDSTISGGTLTMTKTGFDIHMSEIKGCILSRYNSNLFQLRLWDDELDTVAVTSATEGMERLVIDQCVFLNHSEQATAAQPACIDARGAKHITISNCRITVSTSQDFLRVGQRNTVATGIGSEAIRLEKCMIDSGKSITHALDAGFNGAKGTGWTVFGTHTDSFFMPKGVSVDRCTWIDYLGLDAGGVYAEGLHGTTVTNCDFVGVQMATTALSRWSAVEIDAFGTSDNAARIDNILVTGVYGQVDRGFVGVRISGPAGGTVVSNSTFEARDQLGGAYNTPANFGRGAAAGIMVGILGVAVKDFRIHHCKFFDWEATVTTNSAGVLIEADSVRGGNIDHCYFDDCNYGVSVTCTGVVDMDVSHNIHNAVEGQVLFGGGFGFAGGLYGSNLIIMGNKLMLQQTPGGTWTWIDMKNIDDYQVFGNEGSVWGNLNGDGTAVRGRGYNETQDVNHFNAYV